MTKLRVCQCGLKLFLKNSFSIILGGCQCFSGHECEIPNVNKYVA